MRYLRANTSAQATCPSCGDFVLFLRWGHEARCARFRSGQRLRAMEIGAALLLLAVAVFATPAHAQQLDAGVTDKLATGTVQAVLAVIVVALAGVCFYLFRAWREEVQGRREDANVHHAETVGMLTSVVKLNEKMNDGFDVLEDAIDQVLKEERA